jgi:hypothetical protein
MYLQRTLFTAAAPKQPLVVAYGMGVDSTAMLIGLAQRGVRPDLILFADTGGEKPETYLYAPVFRQWLRDVDFPQMEVVRYEPPIAPYDSLYGNCWHNQTLPGLAFGRKSCSIKWKAEPQERRVRTWLPAREAWNAGLKVKKLLGFEAGEEYRRYGDRGDDPRYDHWYPLMDWGWDRETCQRVIADAGLPVPVKSACWYCPAMKKPELVNEIAFFYPSAGGTVDSQIHPTVPNRRCIMSTDETERASRGTLELWHPHPGRTRCPGPAANCGRSREVVAEWSPGRPNKRQRDTVTAWRQVIDGHRRRMCYRTKQCGMKHGMWRVSSAHSAQRQRMQRDDAKALIRAPGRVVERAIGEIPRLLLRRVAGAAELLQPTLPLQPLRLRELLKHAVLIHRQARENFD